MVVTAQASPATPNVQVPLPSVFVLQGICMAICGALVFGIWVSGDPSSRGLYKHHRRWGGGSGGFKVYQVHEQPVFACALLCWGAWHEQLQHVQLPLPQKETRRVAQSAANPAVSVWCYAGCLWLQSERTAGFYPPVAPMWHPVSSPLST